MESKPVKIEGRSVVLVDTPGFDDTLESDMVILARIAAYLEKMSVYIYIYTNHLKIYDITYLPPYLQIS